MSEGALLRVSNFIKVEDDLEKILELKQQFLKEKSTIDTKLTSTMKTQTDSVFVNMNKLKTSADKLGLIKSNLGKINEIYDASITDIKDYDTIKKMTAVNQFLLQVENLSRDVSKFKQYIAYINQLIQEEFEIISEDIAYPMENLLKIHFNLTQARNLQDYLEKESTNLSDDLKSIVQKIVAPMKATVRKFDELLREVIISMTESLKDGNSELVFKLIKVIEFEANEDLKFQLMENLDLNKSKDINSINYSTYRGSRRHYKKFFFDKLEESLADTFNKCVEHFQDDKMQVYDNLNWLEDELVFVVDRLAPIFPIRWQISNFIQNVYYNKLHKFTMEVINSDPPAEDLMKILSYDSHYSNFITALHTSPEEEGGSNRKSIIKKEQKSIIGDELKNVVLEDYLKVFCGKMDEWNDNLMKQETETFSSRDDPPDLYNYHQVIEDQDAQEEMILIEINTEVFVLPDFKTPLSMLKEQADVAADSGYGKILVGVIENWSQCYIKRAVNYQTMIEEEFDKYMSVYNNERFLIKESKTKNLFRRPSAPRPAYEDIENMTEEELAQISKPCLLEYLVALGNTYEINTDRLQDKFLPTYKGKVHSSYQGRIEQAFEDTLTPSTELNAQVIRMLVDIIVNDLYPALSNVFTKSWYDDDKAKNMDEPDMADQIVETICDYMAEMRSYATYELYSVTFNILMDAVVSTYIRMGFENILHGSGKKIDPKAVKKYKSFRDGIERDIAKFYTALEPLVTRKDGYYLVTSLRAIELLGEFATCDDPAEIAPEIWEHEILENFYYCTTDYVKGILLCRKDMDNKQVNMIVSHLSERQKEYHANVEPPAMPISTLNNFFYN